MGKSGGILLMVGILWIGLEIYTEGPSGAFGGALAPMFGQSATVQAADGTPHASTPQRAGAAVANARDAAEERRNRMLGE